MCITTYHFNYCTALKQTRPLVSGPSSEASTLPAPSDEGELLSLFSFGGSRLRRGLAIGVGEKMG